MKVPTEPPTSQVGPVAALSASRSGAENHVKAPASRSLVADQRDASGPPRVWRHGPRSRGLGIFGASPLGFAYPPVSFWLEAQCDEFSGWSGMFSCAPFGYWEGESAEYMGNAMEETQEEQGAEQPSQEVAPFTYVPPPEYPQKESEVAKTPAVLYMRDGRAYAVTNYWLEGGRLHYRTSYGGENAIDMDDLDLQETVDVNAKSGVAFTLKPASNPNPGNAPQPQEQ